jgi:hypothetical protein
MRAGVALDGDAEHLVALIGDIGYCLSSTLGASITNTKARRRTPAGFSVQQIMQRERAASAA